MTQITFVFLLSSLEEWNIEYLHLKEVWHLDNEINLHLLFYFNWIKI